MLRHLSFCLILSLFAPTLFAAEVVKVKGKSALIDLKGDATTVGDLYYALSSDGKRRGIIKISKVKGERAIGRITKGRAEAGMSLELRGAGAIAADASDSSASSGGGDEGASQGRRKAWGFLIGLAQDKMTAKVNDAAGNAVATTNMTGMGFSAKGLFDYELFKSVWFRGSAGLEGFNVSGNSVCSTSNNQVCDAKISYMSLDFMGRYVFDLGKIKPWGGVGVSLLFPASKKATALETNSITTTNAITPAAGLDWHVSPKLYIPLSIEIGILPKSSEVEASWVAFRAGVAFPW